MTKLPEPMAVMVTVENGTMFWDVEDINEAGTYCEENEFPELLYTETQMLQFRRDALEEAIERIEALREDWGDLAEESGMLTSINEIRKLKDET